MVLAVQNFSTGYGQQAIVEAVNLSVEQQEWLCLVGANGSGKSTLLKGISRILPPQAGAVYLNGREIHQLPNPGSRPARWPSSPSSRPYRLLSPCTSLSAWVAPPTRPGGSGNWMPKAATRWNRPCTGQS